MSDIEHCYNEPLVSVIVPVHNTERFISQCIESILNQDYKKTQLIIVDDCSNDKSCEICRKYAEDDARVINVRLHSKCGVSKARNVGISKAKGEYICFVDSDDFLKTGYIRKYVNLINQYKVAVVYGYHMYYQNGIFISRPKRVPKGYHSVEELSSNLIDDGTLTGILFGSACGAIYKSSFLKVNNISFDERLTKNEDGVFNLDLLSKCKKIYVTHYDGYCYRKWKSDTNVNILVPDDGLDMATEAIMQKHSNIMNFACQMKRRNVSIIFWNAINIGACSNSNIYNVRKLRSYMEKSTIDQDYKTLKIKQCSVYKRILIYLLYKKYHFLFCFVIKYIYPFVKRYR
ncbi:glycosyltransferase family 2 protein [Selenomonas ruminantium]|uniref:Glycosyl transferase family 2 n=1 Tax=Selenomonas ruminantium TaxID=971 RepID=A0A1I0XHQ4_SELRU|nr:glycosyltransferase family 2 protein [Selenomonas ruminantium]SFB00629.1 Glycosyl transferase family 2 [Selenomonas ruminantium]